MTVQTRYFRVDTATVNLLLARKLLTTLTDAGGSEAHSKAGNVVAAGATIGIRVWKRTSAGAETEITDAVRATYTQNTSTFGVMVNANWDCPPTALASTDSIVVKVYGKFGADAYTQFGTYAWSTEQLGASGLDAATWTVYYYIDLWYDSASGKTYHDFYFDSLPFNNSRITNFTWTPAAAAAALRRLRVGVGL